MEQQQQPLLKARLEGLCGFWIRRQIQEAKPEVVGWEMFTKTLLALVVIRQRRYGLEQNVHRPHYI
jgi:hypothetical protein